MYRFSAADIGGIIVEPSHWQNGAGHPWHDPANWHQNGCQGISPSDFTRVLSPRQKESIKPPLFVKIIMAEGTKCNPGSLVSDLGKITGRPGKVGGVGWIRHWQNNRKTRLCLCEVGWIRPWKNNRKTEQCSSGLLIEVNVCGHSYTWTGTYFHRFWTQIW